ncbi:MAG: type II toxin-antitoxin system HicA family toxin [Patescibacteria group bacterium]|nr:type II toxin-antitoxin system HicA family toxin [Patescibacteria group bacterium]
MSKLSPLSSKKVLKKLKKAGFTKNNQRGSHLTLKNLSNNRFVTVPIHNKDIPVGTLYNIVVKQAGLAIDEFNNL